MLELLKRYKPENEADRRQQRRLEAFVKSHENCFERTNQEGHVTGSAWLVDRTGENVLLTHHKKLGKWLQLGGHADGSPDVLAVALNEAKEESGIAGIHPVSTEIFDIDVHLIPERNGEPQHFHFDIRFAFQVTGKAVFQVSSESYGLKWIPIRHLCDHTQEKSLLRMARKWMKNYIPCDKP